MMKIRISTALLDEGVMHSYEIRILNADLSSKVVFERNFDSDLTAVRSAREIAGGRPVEVWRGMTCVLAPKPPLGSPTPPTRPAA